MRRRGHERRSFVLRVLVIGGSGYIGGRFIRHLLDSGVAVRAASRSTRAWPAGVTGVLTGCDADAMREACDDVDAVVNLAAMNERVARVDPTAAKISAAGGAKAWAAAAADVGVPRFVQVSTSKVYGANFCGTVTEATTPDATSPYAAAHFAAERASCEAHAGCVVVRLSNGFGAPAAPHADCWDLIVNDFCREAIVDHRISIRSTRGLQRNFIAMPDIVRALELAASRFPPGLYQIGSKVATTLDEMARSVAAACVSSFGFRPAIACESSVSVDGPALQYRIDRALAAGFEPLGLVEPEIRATLSVAKAVFVA